MCLNCLDTSIATVERTRRQLVEEGFEAVGPQMNSPIRNRLSGPRVDDDKHDSLTCGFEERGIPQSSLNATRAVRSPSLPSATSSVV
jgi:hypothetical protein